MLAEEAIASLSFNKFRKTFGVQVIVNDPHPIELYAFKPALGCFRPIDALLRTNSGSWLVREFRQLVEPFSVIATPIMTSLQVMFSAVKVAMRSILMGLQALHEDSLR